MTNNLLQLPSYNRGSCKAGIVHLGVGNFHRAHQAYYINELIDKYEKNQWGIIGINLRENERENFNFLKERDGKYVLKTISTSGKKKYNEIHSIINLYDWSFNPKEAELVLGNPDIEIITMTVTESGYYISETGDLNLDLPIIKNNIEQKEQTIIFSFLRNALKIRKQNCNKPITLLCCDNIRENGVMLKKALNSYLLACNDGDLIDWINENASFPSCVVDRITPKAPLNLKQEIKSEFNINEKCSVMAEPFIQWVIEDNFIGKRPDLEKVGVQFTMNVLPYEEAKIRILNGGHVALSYLGALKNLQTYDQAINDNELQEFFFNLERKEIIPSLGHNIPFDLEKYMLVIFDRFKNENIGDKLERIAMDGVSKFPIWILPLIKKCFEINIQPTNAIYAIAGWYIFMKKIFNKKLEFNYYEPRWEWVQQFLYEDKIIEFATCAELWGNVPNIYPEFKTILNNQILELEKKYI